MCTCPICGEFWSYGWPCQHELMLFIMMSDVWKCSKCKNVFYSQCKVVEKSEDDIRSEMSKLQSDSEGCISQN